MKRIYNKDIKAMKLTEDEMWWAKDTFDDINKNGVDNSLRYYLRTDHYDIKDKTSMLKWKIHSYLPPSVHFKVIP